MAVLRDLDNISVLKEEHNLHKKLFSKLASNAAYSTTMNYYDVALALLGVAHQLALPVERKSDWPDGQVLDMMFV